jgi:hypothetical protein
MFLLVWLLVGVIALICIALGAAFVLSVIAGIFGILAAIISGAWIDILFGKKGS